MKTQFKHPALFDRNPVTGEYDENFGEDGFLCEARWEICSRCSGHGRHFRHDLDETRLVESIIEDGDEEGMELYQRGSYDQVCHECGGSGKVLTPSLPEWANKLIAEWHQQDIADQQYSRMERLMTGG